MGGDRRGTRCCTPTPRGRKGAGAPLSMRGGRPALSLYVPPPTPAAGAASRGRPRSLLPAPQAPGTGSIQYLAPVRDDALARQDVGTQAGAVESVSSRVCLAPLASSALPGASRPFSRAAAPGGEGVRGSSRHFPGAGPGAGLVARFRILGTLVKSGSRVGASRSESTRGRVVCAGSLLGAHRAGNDVLRDGVGSVGVLKRFLLKAGSRKRSYISNNLQFRVLEE